MADTVRSLNIAGPAIAGALQAIALSNIQDWRGQGITRDFQVNCQADLTEGNPAGSGSMRLDNWGFWRFRWAVIAGTMTKSLYVKQAANAQPRPSAILKADSTVGLLVDTAFIAADGVGWVLVQPSFAATASGVIWVELWNNLQSQFYCPCYWSGPDFTGFMNGVAMVDSNSQSNVTPTAGCDIHRVSAKQQRVNHG